MKESTNSGKLYWPKALAIESKRLKTYLPVKVQSFHRTSLLSGFRFNSPWYTLSPYQHWLTNEVSANCVEECWKFSFSSRHKQFTTKSWQSCLPSKNSGKLYIPVGKHPPYDSKLNLARKKKWDKIIYFMSSYTQRCLFMEYPIGVSSLRRRACFCYYFHFANLYLSGFSGLF